MPTTSQPGVGEFVELWEPIVASGSDVLHVSLSSGLSGAFEAASIAARQVMDAHPDRRVLVVDSLGASSGYGMLVEYLADERDEGATLDEAYDWAMSHRLNVHHWFFSTGPGHRGAVLHGRRARGVALGFASWAALRPCWAPRHAIYVARGPFCGRELRLGTSSVPWFAPARLLPLGHKRLTWCFDRTETREYPLNTRRVVPKRNL